MSDSSTERPPKKIEAIRQAISDGKLDAQSMHSTLLMEIRRELQSKEVDMEYVNACEELLGLLNRDRASTVASHYDSNLQAIRKKMHSKPKLSFLVSSRTFRNAMACSMVVVLIFGGILISQNRIDVTQSPNGEQLILQGKSPDEIIPIADADRTAPATETLVTENWDEAVAEYGVTPKVPSWVPDGWKVQQYRISHLEGYSRFAIVYAKGENLVFTFSERTYSDIELLRAEVEQNTNGSTTTLENGATVYIASNLDLPVIEYHKGNSLYVVTGQLGEDELITCISSIPFEEENQ